MNHFCTYCETWTVEITGVETHTGPDGKRRQWAAGVCGACRSDYLTDPSNLAVTQMAAKFRAKGYLEKAEAAD